MSFISYSFAVLYLLALALRWLPMPGIMRGNNGRVFALLLLSWTFYAWHVPWYILLIVASTTVNYVAALALSGTAERASHRKKVILTSSLLFNLGLLAYFKYAGFLVAAINDASGASFSLPQILLPVGISFYTFQSMSYTIDVYRGHIAAERSFLRVACYIAFFPQLVAGPIVRAADFLYQFNRKRHFHFRVFGEGCYLILRGLFLKMVIADNLGSIVDQYWVEAAGDPQGLLAWAMLVLFACQLFCDFAGYVDIARGIAYQLGFRLPINFNAPYIAATFSDFWRRWHITLSTWIRDYLYIPLGGDRKGRARAYVHLVLVMLASGMWHGANWTFLAWGGVLGLALVIERLFGLAKPGRSAVSALGWFLVVQLSWILSMGLFRASNIEQGRHIIGNALQSTAQLFSVDAWSATPDMIVLGLWLTLPVWLMHGRSWLTEKMLIGPVSVYERAVYAGVMLAAVLMLYNSSQQFIYFQF